jgi:hypothetical protein
MTRLCFTILILAFAIEPAITAQSQPVAGAASAPARIPVDAPFAQRLVVKTKAAHPEIQKLGLHATPPGQTMSAIIASNFPEKIGKVSSPRDLQLVAGGQPQAVRIDNGKFWDTFVPIHDRSDTVIGFLVMEVPFATAATQDLAISKGIEIRNEVERQAPTLGALFAQTGR